MLRVEQQREARRALRVLPRLGAQAALGLVREELHLLGQLLAHSGAAACAPWEHGRLSIPYSRFSRRPTCYTRRALTRENGVMVCVMRLR